MPPVHSEPWHIVWSAIRWGLRHAGWLRITQHRPVARPGPGAAGKETPLHCPSNGKALLAFRPPAERRRVLGGPLERLTRRTIVDPAALERQLERVCADRWAFTLEELLAGAAEFARLAEERPGTFFLTDWLVRSFDRAVVRPLGLDRHPELKPVYFGNYTDVLYLCQFPGERLAARAAVIAAYLELPLEVRHVGLGELEQRLAELVNSPSPRGEGEGWGE